MECNKDEAIRAKTIAEKKFADKDFTGAKKFTLKSQNLYPGLDAISQMLVTLDVYIASEKKINGEPDWYAVLDVKPSDDDETIRKQYKKMVLMLHPDKNKSVGADGAFKILSQAWNLLSDKSKKSAYDQRRKFHQKVSPQSTCSSPSSPPFAQKPPVRVPPTVPAKARAQTQTKAKAHAQNPPAARARAPAPAASRKDTFWTLCRGCKMHYEYFKVYLNQTLLCPGCHRPFHAVEVEVAAPINMPKPGGLCNKTSIRPLRPEVHFSMPPSSASKAANFGEKITMSRSCEEFNAQRLAKKKKY